MSTPYRILAVCLGNICRSPIVEAVLRDIGRDRGLDIEVDSAGTGNWHVGKGADDRMVRAAAGRGYDLRSHRARQADTGDFYVYDMILAMDASNLADLEELAPPDGTVRPILFRADGEDVPDPYHGGPDGFDHVIDLAEEHAAKILAGIEAPS